MITSRLVIDIVPVGKPRMTRRSTKSPAAERYWQFKDDLLKWFNIKGYDIYKMDIYEIHLRVGVPMPKSWSMKKKLELYHKPCRSKPDYDNIEKAVSDAICINVNGKGDDSGVWKSSLEKIWTHESEGYIALELVYEPRE